MAAIPFTCERCGGRVFPLPAALCARCGCLLCARHYRWRDRLCVRLGIPEPVCRACRERLSHG